MSIKKKMLKLFISCLVIGNFGCGSAGGTSSESDITSIVLSSNSIELSVDDKQTLSYTVLPETASDEGVSWKSAGTSIATVDQNGVVKGVSEGETNIIVSAPNGTYATCVVKVSQKSAYSMLSDEEQRLVDAMVKASKGFYNPNSIEITYAHQWSTDKNAWSVKVRAQNKMGGNTIDDYELYSDGSIEKALVSHVVMPDDKHDYDLINEALAEKIK